jgi:hypothetical protein
VPQTPRKTARAPRKTSRAPRTSTAQRADALRGIEERIDNLAAGLEAMQTHNRADSARLWAALGTTGGLDGVALGVAEIAELLGPLRSLVPPSTALPPEPGVAEALATIRVALGGRRDTNFAQVPTAWDDPVGFIGQADPSLDPLDSIQFEEQVA